MYWEVKDPRQMPHVGLTGLGTGWALGIGVCIRRPRRDECVGWCMYTGGRRVTVKILKGGQWCCARNWLCRTRSKDSVVFELRVKYRNPAGRVHRSSSGLGWRRRRWTGLYLGWFMRVVRCSYHGRFLIFCGGWGDWLAAPQKGEVGTQSWRDWNQERHLFIVATFGVTRFGR